MNKIQIKKFLKYNEYDVKPLTEYQLFILKQAKEKVAPFVIERMKAYYLRQEGQQYTSQLEPLNYARFTNPYRMLDRVSQHLITQVSNKYSLSLKEKIFRTFLLKICNSPEFYDKLIEHLVKKNLIDTVVKPIFDRVDNNHIRSVIWNFIFIAENNGEKYFRRAYRMFTHFTYSEFISNLYKIDLIDRLIACNSVYELCLELCTIEGLGKFMSYQLAIDLWYTGEYGEMDFVIPGVGAVKGLDYAFNITSPHEQVQILWLLHYYQTEWLTDTEGQKESFTWFKHQVLLISDIQNIFCEYSKYYTLTHKVKPYVRRLDTLPQRLTDTLPRPLVPLVTMTDPR